MGSRGGRSVWAGCSSSSQRAEFHRHEQRFGVRDLGSLNGTYLNRQPADEADLSHGDEIQIGTFRLVFLTSHPR